MDRGEMLIEPGDSWFSPKCMEVQPWSSESSGSCLGGRALDGLGAQCGLPNSTKLRMPRSVMATSEAAGANLRRQEGNNPDRRLRSLRWG